MPTRVKTPPPGGREALAVVRAFDALCRGPLTRGGLAGALDASPSTITTAVRRLQELRFVSETGTEITTGGRRARFLGLSPSLGCVLAADVGAINVRVAAADLQGRILERRTFPTPRDPDPDRFRERLRRALDEVAAAATPSSPLALTLAVSGIVDEQTGSVSLATVPGWPAGSPAEWLGGLGVPVLVENEANLAAVGEYYRASAPAPSSLLFVAVGAGIGAGLIVGGELYRGATGSAGEIGYLRRSPDAAPRQLERGAAAEAVVRLYREAGGEPSVQTAEAVFTRAADGERPAKEAVAVVIDELALALSNAIVLFDPERVVLGGGLGASSGRLLEPLRSRVSPSVPSMPELVVSELGPDAALVGATVWARREATRLLRARLVAEAHG